MSAEFTHKQSLNRMKDITEEIERISAKDVLTGEDEVRWAELVKEFDDLDAHRKNLERAADLAKVRGALKVEDRSGGAAVERGTTFNADGYDLDPVLNPDSVEDRRFRNPWNLDEIRTFSRTKGEVTHELRSRSFSAIEKMAGADDRVREAATKIVENFDDADGKISRMVLATSSPEYLRAWCKIASGRGHMVTPDEQRALNRAMSLTDSAGGYLVPFQLDPTVIITANGSRNDIRRVARSVVATGDVWNGVSSGAVSWSWDAEGTEVSDDATTFGQPSIPVYKAAGFVPISLEALEDEANVTAEVARLLAFGKDTLEAAAFATGDGSGKPTGIVTALAAASPSVSDTATGNATALDAADIYKVDSNLPARHRVNASWLANRSTFNAVRAIDTAGSGSMWERIGAGLPPQLLGQNVYESEDMADIQASAKVAVYGDFSNYVIADRIGMTVEFIPHLFGTSSGRPKGQRGWYAYYRVGADSVNDGAFRLLVMDSSDS